MHSCNNCRIHASLIQCSATCFFGRSTAGRGQAKFASRPVVSGFTLVPTFSNPSCATIRRKLLQKAPRGEGPLLACRLPVSEEKTATNERDCNRNEQGSSVPRLSGSSDLPNYFPATRNAKKETGCVGARQRRPSAPSVGLQIAQGWTSMAFVSIPSSARGGVVGWSDRR